MSNLRFAQLPRLAWFVALSTLALSAVGCSSNSAPDTTDLEGRVAAELLADLEPGYVIRLETKVGKLDGRFAAARVKVIREALEDPRCTFVEMAEVNGRESQADDLRFLVQCRGLAPAMFSEKLGRIASP